MEATKIHQNPGAQSKLKVVKVVEMKRFMPKSHASPVFKRKNLDYNPFKNFNANLPKIVPEEEVKIKIEIPDDPVVEVENKVTENEVNEIESPIKVEETSNTCRTKLTGNQKSKIKFRNCSHTFEELSKLTEHQDVNLLKVGDMFDSREAFRQYLNDNAKRWCYYYVCRTSKKNFLEYNCICMAYTIKPKDIVIRRQKKRTTACPCKMRLTVDEATNKVIVYYVCNHHDHDLTETAFYHYPHAKYLPQDVKDLFLDLAYLGLDIDLIQNYMNSLVGLKIKRKDISSYVYKFKRKTSQRNLTADRTKYITDLISTIRETYNETIEQTLEKNSDEDCKTVPVTKPKKTERSKRRKSQSISKKGQKSCPDLLTLDDDGSVNYNYSEDNMLDNVLDTNSIDLMNYDVIVQYINEEGILCDQNGTPVTNSSAIMQFINNYEYVMPESGKDEFLEEGTVFSELVNINDDLYPLDWDSIQETKPEIEGEANEISTLAEITDDVDGNSVNIAEEAKTVERETCPDQGSRVTILSNDIVNFETRLSPTRESPALYAEMDIFKKYYFVDHRYIKYEDENCEEQKRIAAREKKIDRQGLIAMWAMAHGEEYIKAPEFDHIPTPLRLCSGHENLILLTDTDVILPGAKFLTHEIFLKYINERANRWFFYYSLVESGKVPEYYVYKCVFGKNRASKNAYRAKGLRKRSKLTTQCPCQIRLRRQYSDPAYLTVLYSCNHHDHGLDAQLFKAQPHSRRLPEHIKEEVKDLLSIGASFDVLRTYVISETGLRIYGKYFHNVRVKMRRDEERRQFTEERFEALKKKIKDMEAIIMYGRASKENTQFETSLYQAEKLQLLPSQIQMEDQYVQVSFDEAATQTQEYYQLARIDDIAEEVCIVQADSLQTHAIRKHSRLEKRLQNLSSHEDTLLKVKKLQESVRSENLRNTYEVVQISSIV